MFKKIVVCGMVAISLFMNVTLVNVNEMNEKNYYDYINYVIDYIQDTGKVTLNGYYSDNELHIFVTEDYMEENDSVHVIKEIDCYQEIIIKNDSYKIYAIEVKTERQHDFYKANTYRVAIDLAQPLFISESKCQEMLTQGNKYNNYYTEKTYVEYKTDYTKTITSITLHEYVQTF